MKENQLTTVYRNNFVGGLNNYLGSRQVKDNESPNIINCDFKGLTGIGNRLGYTQIGTVTDSRIYGRGMNEFHTASYDQAIKFASNGTNTALGYSTGGAWTFETTVTFNKDASMDTVQAGDKLYTFNGVDDQATWSGSATASYSTEGKKLLYGEYYNKRLWGVSPTAKDTLYFSTQYGDATKSLSFNNNGTSSNPGSLTFNPGSGEQIKGIKKFKDYLYVWLTNAIYRLSPASAANTFTAELVTKSVGCVSHRSIAQVGEDIFFAADDGVYSLGDVANYTDVRTTNKSLRIQSLFTALTGTNKSKLSAVYYNFKYHLFYSLYGTINDSCMVYDIRYNGWLDWRNVSANDATSYLDNTSTNHLYFIEVNTGKVHELYSGSTDDGTAITSTWYSKSFDEGIPDIIKLYFDTTLLFGELNGTITISIIFDDDEIALTQSLSQNKPQGGFGRDTFGKNVFGKSTNNNTVVQVSNVPKRVKAKGQKFAIQYRISSTGQWRLDKISQTFIPFKHFKFPSSNKLN